MTIAELITELEKIEDKTLEVGNYQEATPWHIFFISYTTLEVKPELKRVVLS